MEKWEYLEVDHTNTTMKGAGVTRAPIAIRGTITILTTIPVSIFADAFPGDKVTSRAAGTIIIEFKDKAYPDNSAYCRFLNWLGEQGWEAFAVSQGMYYFKRRIAQG